MAYDAMKLISKRKEIIDKELEALFPRYAKEWIERALGKPKYFYDTRTVQYGLTEQIWEFLNRGGKRWRPALMISACKALNGPEKLAAKFSPLIEFVHEGTLLVDDVEDNADLRRGKPAMHKIYGIDCAVNTGNAMYFIPLEILYKNELKLTEKKIVEIYNIYAQEMLRLSVGQAMDIWWHKGKNKAISEPAYLQMCAYKTGVLARFAAKLGAILADAKRSQVEALGNFGEALGVAFQIQDDILNIAPKSEHWGKEIGEDISEGKRTLLIIRAKKVLPKREAKLLESILNSHTKNKKKILKAIALIKKSDAVVYSAKKARLIVEKAWADLEKKIPENEGKQELKAFADFAINRNI
ncbi:MAG: polyprenyl synthetase family protein [Candidatus Diapherotrites archaeon]|nr:polyprenyl synthetase family protein [Candidatus Diapherotrites archaeon]